MCTNNQIEEGLAGQSRGATSLGAAGTYLSADRPMDTGQGFSVQPVAGMEFIRYTSYNAIHTQSAT